MSSWECPIGEVTMIHATKAGARGIVIYGTIGLAVGFLIAFCFAPCGAGQEPPLQEQMSISLQFAGAFAAVGFLIGFVSALLFDQTTTR
jgi:hypothetical protein